MINKKFGLGCVIATSMTVGLMAMENGGVAPYMQQGQGGAYAGAVVRPQSYMQVGQLAANVSSKEVTVDASRVVEGVESPLAQSFSIPHVHASVSPIVDSNTGKISHYILRNDKEATQFCHAGNPQADLVEDANGRQYQISGCDANGDVTCVLVEEQAMPAQHTIDINAEAIAQVMDEDNEEAMAQIMQRDVENHDRQRTDAVVAGQVELQQLLNVATQPEARVGQPVEVAPVPQREWREILSDYRYKLVQFFTRENLSKVKDDAKNFAEPYVPYVGPSLASARALAILFSPESKKANFARLCDEGWASAHYLMHNENEGLLRFFSFILCFEDLIELFKSKKPNVKSKRVYLESGENVLVYDKIVVGNDESKKVNRHALITKFSLFIEAVASLIRATDAYLGYPGEKPAEKVEVASDVKTSGTIATLLADKKVNKKCTDLIIFARLIANAANSGSSKETELVFFELVAAGLIALYDYCPGMYQKVVSYAAEVAHKPSVLKSNEFKTKLTADFSELWGRLKNAASALSVSSKPAVEQAVAAQ